MRSWGADMAWWQKALNIGGAAAKGYTDTAKEGLAPHLGKVAGSLLKKKRGLKVFSEDPADEAESNERYRGTNWEDTENGDI